MFSANGEYFEARKTAILRKHAWRENTAILRE